MRRMVVLVLICWGGICAAQKDSAGGFKPKPPDYQSSVSKGDLALSSKDYSTAKRFYKQALLAKPGDTYSAGQIDVCDKKMSSDGWIGNELNCPCNSGKISKKFEESGGQNVEITANDSTVYSIIPGKVSSVSIDSGSRTIVLVKHGKYYITYSNLSGAFVKVGDDVKEGDPVGYFYKSEGKYLLRLSIYDGKEKQDPKKFVRCKSQP